MAKAKKTFQQRVELRVNSVLIALDRLSRVSNGENVVNKTQADAISKAVKPAVESCLTNITSKDRQASGFKF